jgi:hypothetical protein
MEMFGKLSQHVPIRESGRIQHRSMADDILTGEDVAIPDFVLDLARKLTPQ